MFDDATIRAFHLRHPDLTLDEVSECARWVGSLHQREHLENPNAVLEGLLQRKSTERSAAASTRSDEKPMRNPQPRVAPRSFMTDEEWQASDAVRRTEAVKLMRILGPGYNPLGFDDASV